jgi:hypothetical protein
MRENERDTMPGPVTFHLCPDYPTQNPYTPWQIMALLAALLLIAEAVALAYTRRTTPRARRQPWLAVLVWAAGAWALLLAFWIWAVGSTFVGGPCAGPVTSWPVPAEHAEVVAELASTATLLVACLLLVAGAAVSMQRQSRRGATDIG